MGQGANAFICTMEVDDYDTVEKIIENGELLPCQSTRFLAGIIYSGFQQSHILLTSKAPDILGLRCLCWNNITFLRDDTFVCVSKEFTQHNIIDSLPESAGFKPNILIETSGNRTKFSM